MLLLAAWCVGVGSWLIYLEVYVNTPGRFGIAPQYWPDESSIPHSDKVFTLVMFIHPQCPCTRASIEELNRIVAGSRGLADMFAVFIRPPGFEKGWERTDLWDWASEIPGVTLLADPDGVEAARFGATTSGEVRLYHVNKHLVFRGGITGARGHAGSNVGSDSVYSWLRWGNARRDETFVFGCPLFDDAPNGGSE